MSLIDGVLALLGGICARASQTEEAGEQGDPA